MTSAGSTPLQPGGSAAGPGGGPGAGRPGGGGGSGAGGGGRLSREQQLLLITASISLVVHLIMLALTGNLPIGRFDPALLAEQNRLITVQRLADDKIIDDSTDPTSPDHAAADQEQDLTALSQDLLADDQNRTDDADAGPEPTVQLRQLPEERISQLIRQMAVTAPKVNLPGTLPGGLGQRIDIEVRYGAPRGGAGGGTGAGTAAGAGTGGGVSLTVRDAAQQMLEEQSDLLTGPSTLPQPVARPKISDRRDRNDDTSVVEAPLNPPAIDFMAVAELDADQISRPAHLDNDFDYTLTRFPPGQLKGLFGLGRDDDPRGYFQLEVKPKRSLRKLTAMPKDIVFLIDTSGSIPQKWVDQVLRGVSSALNRLNKGDRFNIVFFDEQTVIFSPDAIRPFDSQALAEAQQFLTDRKASGYTDVNRALSRLVVRDVAVERVYDLIMISDGKPTRGPMDTRELINMVTRDFDLTASIYCVGIGPSPNRELLEFLAYRNKGLCVFADQADDAVNAIDQLASRLRFPIIKGVSTSIIGLDGNEVFPRDLPNIHQSEVFHVFGRYEVEKQFTIRMVGTNGSAPIDFTVERDLRTAAVGGDDIARQWAFWKLHDLYNRMIRGGDTEQLKQDINQLRRKYKLKTVYE